MRRIVIYRECDDRTIVTQICPDIVLAIAGFGKTVVQAIRDLADCVENHNYELPGNCIGIEVAGAFVEVQGRPDDKPPDIIRALADIIEERGYRQEEFPAPDWKKLTNEEPVTRPALN